MASIAPAVPKVLVSPQQGLALLRALDSLKVERVAEDASNISTSDGPILDKTVEELFAEVKVVMADDKTFYFMYKNKPLEICFSVSPRSTWAFNNGPTGNFALPSWKTGEKLPKGVSIDLNTGSYESWTKTSRSANSLELSWRTQLWPANFRNTPRQVEMSMSGTPVTPSVFDYAKKVHEAVDRRFGAHSREMGVEKRASSNGPSSTMFVTARRSIVLPNAVTLDEGRASEYQATNTLLSDLGPDSDLKFNRVPSVKLWDYRAREYVELSWHEVHRLGSGVVINMSLAPHAFVTGGTKKELMWEFRLLELRIAGKVFLSFLFRSPNLDHWQLLQKSDDILLSPTKLSAKRHVASLDFSDSEDEQGKVKRVRLSTSAGSSGSSSSSGGGPSSSLGSGSGSGTGASSGAGSIAGSSAGSGSGSGAGAGPHLGTSSDATGSGTL
ncbi:hypothetical protein GGX14DRAFT_388106 [Mycena pura]|uniref:Uncharacterized protein n=1 Tax=Mycena pura TaxID=153505 RepID=A0AAD6VWB6_9AGAR|nr:hypothetical protein GGX14DRAFT_388106 [Mycena pura]